MSFKDELAQNSSRTRKTRTVTNLIDEVTENRNPSKSNEENKDQRLKLFFPEREQRTQRLSIVMTPSLYTKIKDKQKASGARSLNEFIIKVLELYCEEDS